MAMQVPSMSERRPFLQAQDLAGKVALVTGASKGIGRAIAYRLASRGCNILGTCTSTSSLPRIGELATEIGSLFDEKKSAIDSDNVRPPRVEGLVLSLDDTNAPTVVFDAVSNRFGGRIDIFISSAAAVDRTPVGRLEAALVSNMLLSNIQTPAMIIDELVKRKYFQPDSRIVFISSAESSRCDPSALMYGTTKAASEAMARCYANAFGGKSEAFSFMAGTTSNSVFTGLTATTGPQQFGEEVFKEFQDYWIPRQAIPRLGMPEDVASVVGLLCSDEGRWITGSKVSACGGAIGIL